MPINSLIFDFESFANKIEKNEEENYYSFMNDSDLNVVFQKIFIK